jgi:hypothetical protein
MCEPRSASVENSRAPDALIALVRLLARQAVREFAAQGQTPSEIKQSQPR